MLLGQPASHAACDSKAMTGRSEVVPYRPVSTGWQGHPRRPARGDEGVVVGSTFGGDVSGAEDSGVTERRVSREQVLAFRAAAQSLDRRRPTTELLDVVGACGIQDTPHGNADVALGARLDIDAPVVAEAVSRKELALTWSLRGAPHVLPPSDLAVFTLGARPAAGTLTGLWGQPEHSLVEVEKAMVAAIRSKPRPKAEVSAAVTASLPAELAPWCRSCKAHHPSESVFRAAPLLGRLVLTSTAPVLLAKAKAWLGADASGDVDVLRTELLRR